MKFFISDTHFDHEKLVKLCKYPFANVEEYNETVIRNWNKVVTPADTVYHLGDFGFHKDLLRIITRLNGSLILICGNHDRNNIKNIMHRFSVVKDLHETHVGEARHPVVMCHYPMQSWNRSHYGAFHLHGHCHGSMQPYGRRMDVGCMLHGWAPVSETKVIEVLGSQEFIAPVHVMDADPKWLRPLNEPAKVNRMESTNVTRAIKTDTP